MLPTREHLLIAIRLLLLGILFTAAAPVFAEPLVVATVKGNYDTYAGLAVMREAYGRIGQSVEFRAFPASGALQASNSGEAGAELQRIDGISNRFPNLVQIPIPINLIQGVAWSKKYRFPVKGWHSLRPYRIGIVEGILFAEQNTAGMDVGAYPNYPELLDALIRDEIDVAVMPRVEGRMLLGGGGDVDIVEMEGILETLFLYHYVHASRKDVAKRLAPVLKEMLLSGETRRIRDAVLKDPP